MKFSRSSKRQVYMISKKIKKEHEAISFGFYLNTLKKKALNKPSSVAFGVVITLLVLFVFGGIIYGVYYWMYTSPTFDMNKKTDFGETTHLPKQHEFNQTNPKKIIDVQYCTKIEITSSGVANQLYPKLFGVYGSVGSFNGSMAYKNQNADAFLSFENTYITINDERRKLYWKIANKDYMGLELHCNDLISYLGSNCNHEWMFCSVTSSLNEYFTKAEFVSIESPIRNDNSCMIDDTVAVKCHDETMAAKSSEKEDEEKAHQAENSLQSKNDVNSDSICKEFEFSAKYIHTITYKNHRPITITGIYTLQDFRHNDNFVYKNKEKGVFFYYSFPPGYNDKRNDLRFNDGVWTFSPHAAPNKHYDLAVVNPSCMHADSLINGNCEFGWHYLVESSETIQGFKIDMSAFFVCAKPKSMIVTNTICTKFQLTSRNPFNQEWVLAFLGEYKIMMDSYFNGKVVYHKFDPLGNQSMFLYFISHSKQDFEYWVIGLELGLEKGSIVNWYCSEVEYPANGGCNAGWFYENRNTNISDYDPTMDIQCAEYL